MEPEAAAQPNAMPKQEKKEGGAAGEPMPPIGGLVPYEIERMEL